MVDHAENAADMDTSNYMEKAAAAAQEEVGLDTAIEEGVDNDIFEGDAEVPSFFDEEAVDEGSEESQDQSEQPAVAGVEPALEQHSYRANGQEFQIDFTTDDGRKQALKALSMEKGARRALTANSRMRKQLETANQKANEGAEFREVWEKLEELRDDTPKMIELLTGQNYEEIIKGEIDRRTKYADASDDERSLMDKHREYEGIQRKFARLEADHKKREEALTTQRQTLAVKGVENLYAPIFEKHADFKSQGHTAHAANALREHLWQSSLTKLESLGRQGKYDPQDPRVVEAVFKSRARAMIGHADKVAENKAESILQEKKTTAQQQAQLASTGKYPGAKTDWSSHKGKDPVTLFQEMFKR